MTTDKQNAAAQEYADLAAARAAADLEAAYEAGWLIDAAEIVDWLLLPGAYLDPHIVARWNDWDWREVGNEVSLPTDSLVLRAHVVRLLGVRQEAARGGR